VNTTITILPPDANAASVQRAIAGPKGQDGSRHGPYFGQRCGFGLRILYPGEAAMQDPIDNYIFYYAVYIQTTICQVTITLTIKISLFLHQLHLGRLFRLSTPGSGSNTVIILCLPFLASGDIMACVGGDRAKNL
jgi:hypothetical protein